MRFPLRIILFLATNLAVLLVLSVVLGLLGLPRTLEAEYGIPYASLFVIASVFGFGGSLISLALSKFIARTVMRVKVIKSPSNELEDWLQRTVSSLARQAGICMPEVGIYDSPDMNAFATGASRNSALVAVSTGLLRGMSRQEVEAVLAHEVSHCSNGDMVTLALIQGVLNTFIIFLSRIAGIVVDRVILRNERGMGIGYFATVIVSHIVLGILASIIVAFFSRKREFRADADAARLVGARPMASALETLKRTTSPSALPDSMRAFGIRGGRGGLMALLASHPPLDARIAKLREGNTR